MKKYSVKCGKRNLVLTKSQIYVGIKPQSFNTDPHQIGVQKQVLRHLGGFQMVTLKKDQHSLDDQLDDLRKSRSIAVGTHVYYAEGSKRPIIPTGEIFIHFNDKTNKEEQKIVLDEYALQIVEERSANFVIAKVTKNSPNPLKVADALQNISMVDRAEPDLDTLLDEYGPEDQITDELFSHSWHLKNTGSVVDLNYPLKTGADAKVVDAWQRLGNLGSKEIVIAVIDNGFDLTHQDLNQKIFRPYDIWNQSSSIIQGDPRFTHGTPCASVALAAANGKGIVGAAPMAKFMPISGTSFSYRATEEMFEKAVQNGADIISCSWGTTDINFAPGELKEEVIAKAAREGRNGKGCIILYAAGNDAIDHVNYYGAHPDVICVGASTSQDRHADYSNKGKELTIVAPSNGDWPIIAARANWDEGTSVRGGGEFKYWADGRSRGSQYKHFGGTSSATPLVAGICALMLSANPDLTAKEVKQILSETADQIGMPFEYVNGHSLKYGYGRVNADKAVREAIRRKGGNIATGGSTNGTTTGGNTSSTGGSTTTRPSTTPTTPSTKPATSAGQGLFKFEVERQAAKGYGVQIGVYAEYANVLIAAEALQREFNRPTIVNINELNGKTVYKVIVGPYFSRGSADSVRRQMERAGERGFVVNLDRFQVLA